MVFDENARLASKIYGSWSEGSEKEIAAGLVKKADTLEELAKIIGVDAKGLQTRLLNTTSSAKPVLIRSSTDQRPC